MTTSGSHLPLVSKDSWLVILHALRVPPHVGLMIDGNYNSLTIKGHELNVNCEVLLKAIQQKKIETVFLRLEKHPVFSNGHLLEVFQHLVQQFPYVKQGVATCLHPLKDFFSEFYALQKNENELLFQLEARLEENEYIRQRIFLNIAEKLIKNGKFILPKYSAEQLQEVIKKERSDYYKD
jgi:hypothetical protein